MAEPISVTFQYRIITWALLPVAAIHTAYIAVKHKQWQYFSNRFAHYHNSHHTNNQQPIWCHCASVGEINTAIPLLNSLIAQGHTLVVTTNTVTGFASLSKAKLDNTTHVYLPLDYALLAKRFLNLYKPKHCFVFETELWPSILITTIKHNIDVMIVNGRISKKTLSAPAFILKNYRRILSNTQKILSSSSINSARFIDLGADADKVTTLDNLKFAQITSLETHQHTPPLNYPYLLCASTHADEEHQILSAWSKCLNNSLGCVIAMRHPHRLSEVKQILSRLNLNYCLHSERNPPVDKEIIYVIDTLGELQPFIAHAQIVFMGGSLTPIGGHNIIEPASYKRCILIGPHYQNFKTIVDDLITHQGIKVVNSASELVDQALNYQADSESLFRMGENAYKFIASKKHVLREYEKEIYSSLTR